MNQEPKVVLSCSLNSSWKDIEINKPIAKQIYDFLSYLDLGKHFASINAMGGKKEEKRDLS